MASRTKGDGPTIIKKYANRRLYDTGSSSYITLDNLAGMVRDEVDFKVVDAKTGDDITHAILTQIILDEESTNGDPMLPVSFLRDLISMYGNSMQSVMPAYLEASMAQFREHQSKFVEAFGSSTSANPFQRIAETNLAIMRAATEAFLPTDSGKTEKETPAPDEMASMREQMAMMQKRLDQLEK